MGVIEKIAGLNDELDDTIEDNRDDSFTADDATHMSEFPISGDTTRKSYPRSLSEEDASNMESLEKKVDPVVVEDVRDSNFTASDFKNMSEFNN